MKVLLVHPPVRIDQEPLDMPQGLMMLYNISMNLGHQTALMDLNSYRPPPSWRDVLKQMSVEKWDVIFQQLTNLQSWYILECMKKLCLFVINHSRQIQMIL